MADANDVQDRIFHVHDAATRMWSDGNLAEVAAWLDPAMAAVPEELLEKLGTRFAVPTVEVDLLIKAGEGRLIHVEFQASPDPDLVERMYDYRGRIMRAYPGMRLTQYVVVLGAGTLEGFDDFETYGFRLDVRAIYLRDHDPKEFLGDPFLALFAALARGSRAVREESLGAAFRLLRTSNHPQRNVLLQATDGLAGLRLDRLTIDRIKKENGMSIEPMVEFYRETEVGHRLRDMGREQGREEGREEGRERLLLALLQSRFGDHPKVRGAAHRLAAWGDESNAVAAVLSAPDVESMLGEENSTDS